MDTKDLISHPGIWRGLEKGAGAHAAAAALPTGFCELDQYLPDGGWSRRAVTEIYLDRYGIGELSLLMPALASLSRLGNEQWLVWIAPPFVPYAPALIRCGVDLSRVLLVHPTRAKRDALWAAEQAIRSNASVAVLAWIADADQRALRRLQLGAEESRCWTVIFRPLAALAESSPAALRIRLTTYAGRARLDIVKCRGRRPQTIDLEDMHTKIAARYAGRVEWR
jgi:protein ImuA